MGRSSRSASPHHRVRRFWRGAASRFSGSQLEGRRQGHGSLQLCRRPGSRSAQRLDAGHQPAHLGLRDQLRWLSRSRYRQGQPAHAQTIAPHMGRSGGKRVVQLDQLPHVGWRQWVAHEARRQRPDLGCVGRHRRIRDTVRTERRRHPGVCGVITRKGHLAQ